MTTDYYLCDNGHGFHASDIGEHSIPRSRDCPAEYRDCCPECGSEDIAEANRCEVCGEFAYEGDTHECKEDAR